MAFQNENSRTGKGSAPGTMMWAAGAVLLAGLMPATEAAAQARKPKPPAAVQLTNARQVILTALVVRDAEGTVVGSLAQPLAGGKSLRLALKKPKGCLYAVAAAFEDESEAEIDALDLCKDAKLRLVD